MSRFVSTMRRFAGSELLQDICALVAMGGFLLVMFFGCAGAVMIVSEWRAGL